MKLKQKTSAYLCLFAVVFAIGCVTAASAEPVKIDFEEYEKDSEPDDLFVIEGTFTVIEEDESKVLRLEPQPLSESGIIFGKSMKGAGEVSAEIKSTRKRRSTPRFGIGLHGISGYRLRVVPAKKKVELVKSEEVVKTAAFDWASGEWTNLRLVIEGADEKWIVKGWVWAKGKEAPKEPTISLESDKKPGQGKASIWGTPYAGTPIFFDNIRIIDTSGQ